MARKLLAAATDAAAGSVATTALLRWFVSGMPVSWTLQSVSIKRATASKAEIDREVEPDVVLLSDYARGSREAF